MPASGFVPSVTVTLIVPTESDRTTFVVTPVATLIPVDVAVAAPSVAVTEYPPPVPTFGNVYVPVPSVVPTAENPFGPGQRQRCSRQRMRGAVGDRDLHRAGVDAERDRSRLVRRDRDAGLLEGRGAVGAR